MLQSLNRGNLHRSTRDQAPRWLVGGFRPEGMRFCWVYPILNMHWRSRTPSHCGAYEFAMYQRPKPCEAKLQLPYPNTKMLPEVELETSKACHNADPEKPLLVVKGRTRLDDTGRPYLSDVPYMTQGNTEPRLLINAVTKRFPFAPFCVKRQLVPSRCLVPSCTAKRTRSPEHP